MKRFNLLLIGIFCVLLLSNCGPRALQDDWYHQVIAQYLIEQGIAKNDYYPKKFEIVDEAFLASQKPIQSSLSYLDDLFHDYFITSLNFVCQTSINYDSDQIDQLERINSEINQLPELKLDTLTQYISTGSAMEGYIRNIDVDNSVALIKKYELIEQEIDFFERILRYYNLSLYNLDIANRDSLIVYHQYDITDQSKPVHHESIFEIDKIRKEVIVEKTIN